MSENRTSAAADKLVDWLIPYLNLGNSDERDQLGELKAVVEKYEDYEDFLKTMRDVAAQQKHRKVVVVSLEAIEKHLNFDPLQ